MIPVKTLLNDLDDKLNKNSNLVGQFIPNETKIGWLNKGQIKLILKKIGYNNEYQLGLDSFKKRYEDLQFLIVPYESLTTTKVVGDVFNSYTSDTNSLSNSLFIPIDAYVLADKGNCKSRVIAVTHLVKHGDLQIKLKSPHYNPNFRYQETLSTMSGDNFYTYGDKDDTFKITSLYLSYLRYPKYIDIPGYIHLDGTASTLENCELDSYLENELIELVVEEIADATGNQEVSQTSRARTKETE